MCIRDRILRGIMSSMMYRKCTVHGGERLLTTPDRSGHMCNVFGGLCTQIRTTANTYAQQNSPRRANEEGARRTETDRQVIHARLRSGSAHFSIRPRELW